MQTPATGLPTTADLIRAIWPMEDRPDEMKADSVINSMTMDTVLMYKHCWDEKR